MRYLIVILGLVALVGGLVAIKGAQIGMLIGTRNPMHKARPPPHRKVFAVKGDGGGMGGA